MVGSLNRDVLPNSNDLNVARARISLADASLCRALSQFSPASIDLKPSTVEFLTDRVKASLGNCPPEMLTAILDKADLRHRSRSAWEQPIVDIAMALNARFEATADVAQIKRSLGIREAYDDVRHRQVLDMNVRRVMETNGNPVLAERAFKAVMDLSVAYQNEYLQRRTGPIANALNSRHPV